MCPFSPVIFLLCLNEVFGQSLLNSPCPNIFQYKTDQNGVLFGKIEILVPSNNVIQINLELSVGNRVGDYNGNIELAYPRNQILDNILQHRPIEYHVSFPRWEQIPPKITNITVNGDLMCSGPKVTMNQAVSVLTTINLQHTLTINANSLRTEDDLVPKRNGFVPLPKNFKINFNPQKSNPEEPKPSKIPEMYSRNPFLSSFLSNNPGNEENNVAVPESSDRTVRFPGKVLEMTELVSTTLKPRFRSMQTQFLRRQMFPEICGMAVTTNSLIVNGQSIIPRGAFPWLVAIFEVKNTGLEYKCSGSLISHQQVVTAAHCLKIHSRKLRPQELLVVLGKMNIQKWTLGDGEKMVEPLAIHIHPDYKAMSSDADIAVIELSESVEFSKFIRPICLWSDDDDLERIVGDKGAVVGWGRDENGLIVTAEPKKTVLPVVSQEQCLRSSPSFQFITSERTFCAGFRNGSGPCNGDSGSGFIMKKEGRWILRGVVSMSISDMENRTCDLSNYVVFTDASKYLEWLLSFI